LRYDLEALVEVQVFAVLIVAWA